MKAKTDWAGISMQLRVYGEPKKPAVSEHDKALADAYHHVSECKSGAARGRDCKECAVKALRLQQAAK